MLELVLDVEVTYETVNGRTDPSPYNKNNKLVYVGISELDKDPYGFFFNHKDRQESKESFTKLQSILDTTELLIGHNLKFDLSWLNECGLTYDRDIYDTMVAAYVFSKGLKTPLSLKELAIQHNLTHKLDIFKKYFDLKINTDSIPYAELEEYCLGDIITTKELYMYQKKLLDA